MIPRPTSLDATLPVEMAAANRALRIRNTFEDDVLERKLWAAIEYIEWRTGRYMRAATLEAMFCDWPVYDWRERDTALLIEAAPVREIIAVEYRDANGAWQEVAAEDYDWNRTETGARVFFFTTFSPPGLSTEYEERVRVTADVGYYAREDGATGTDPEVIMPARLEEGMLSLAGHWFANREAVTAGEKAAVPMSLKMLLDSLRIYR